MSFAPLLCWLSVICGHRSLCQGMLGCGPRRHDWDGWSKVERSARPPSARAAVRAGASGSPNAAHASPREHTRSQSSSETSHPAGQVLLESPELRSRHGVQLMGSPTQHTAMLFDLQQQGHIGLPPPPAGMRSISPGLRLLGPGLSGGEGSSDGGGGLGGGLSGGGFLSGMSQLGGGGPFGGDPAMPSIDDLALHNPRAGAAMLHGYGDAAGMMHGGPGAAGGPLPMRMLSGSGMRSPRGGGGGSVLAVHQLLGHHHHPDSVLASASVLDSRLGSAPSSFMLSGSGGAGGQGGLVVHSGGGGGAGMHSPGAMGGGGTWRYSVEGQSHSQNFLTGGGGGGGPHLGGFGMPPISTQPQSSPSISDSNCRWVRHRQSNAAFRMLSCALLCSILATG